jgi:hypothetical protein
MVRCGASLPEGFMRSVISGTRLLAKRILRRLPLCGPWFARCLIGRQRLALLRALRGTARSWRVRIADVLACPDNVDIPRVADAGRKVNGDIIMHNGLRVAYGTYGVYDTQETMRVLEVNRGVHEPQEEKIFQQVLSLMPLDAVMLELGAFWGFYSLWFASVVKNGRCFLVEPVWSNLNAGRLNFALNGLRGIFINGFVGARHRRQPFQPPVLAVDWLMREHSLEKIHLLHSDIQGFEREMLDGAQRAVIEERIDWMFISTHAEKLHQDCREWLVARGWAVVADASLAESYSVDGLLVAHRPGLYAPPLQSIARKGYPNDAKQIGR